MVILKRAFSLLANSTFSTVKCTLEAGKHGKVKHMFATSFAISNIQSRSICSHDITKNMQYITNEKGVSVEKDPKTLKLYHPTDKPLCILINWLLAKQKHVLKYASLYLDQGYDVLSVSCTPWQLLWPMKGSQLVAADLLKFMESNTTLNPFLVHGFSVAGYLWGEVCLLVSQDKQRYQPVLDRIVAQTWDSAADISEFAIGVPKSVFPKNQVMENALRKYIIYHLKTFHQVATVHYMRSSQQFHTNLCKAPALFLLSKSDLIGAENSNRKVHDSWVSLGIKTSWQCWDKSPHVQHFTKHPQEYLAALNSHLDGLGLISKPEKMQMRL